MAIVMAMIVKNLGQISAVFKGTSAPDNKELLWLDTTTDPTVKKIWDPVSCTWEAITPENIIEQEIVQIATDGVTDSFIFTHDLSKPNYDYIVQIDLEDVDGFIVQTPTTVLKRINDVVVTFSAAPVTGKVLRCIIHYK